MRSDARKRLHVLFSELEVGDTFQLVNNLMGAALPSADTFKKIESDDANAINIVTNERHIIRLTQKVEKK